MGLLPVVLLFEAKCAPGISNTVPPWAKHRWPLYLNGHYIRIRRYETWPLLKKMIHVQ